jgi:hypothetical protein
VTDLLVFGALVAVVAAAGIWLGMLIAPRLGRLADPPDEDEGGDDD